MTFHPPSPPPVSTCPLSHLSLIDISGQDTLRHQRGRQTYVGCSIQQGGKLRVQSYLNLKQAIPAAGA